MQFGTGQDYTISAEWGSYVESKFLRDALEILEAEPSEEKLRGLTEVIAQVCTKQLTKSDLYVFEGGIGGVRFSTVESILSIVLMQRGLTFGQLCQKRNSSVGLSNAFLDFNHSIEFSLSPETLGVCSALRAYYLPKKADRPQSFEYIPNEYNVARLAVANGSNLFKAVFGSHTFPLFSPKIYYLYILEEEASTDLTYARFELGDLTTYRPLSGVSPLDPLHDHSFIGHAYSQPDYKLLSRYRNYDVVIEYPGKGVGDFR